MTVGQFGPAPPAADRVVTSKIVRLSQDRVSERCEPKLAFVVTFESRAIIVQFRREGPFLKTRHKRLPAPRETIEQRALLPIAEYSAGIARLVAADVTWGR